MNATGKAAVIKNTRHFIQILFSLGEKVVGLVQRYLNKVLGCSYVQSLSNMDMFFSVWCRTLLF